MLDKTIRTTTPQSISSLLSHITDPPQTLRIQGEFPLATHTFLTIIGSRKYSEYGKSVCEMLIAGLSGYPIVIVSGLALGMDSIAHRSALDNGLTTIAVPGSGLGDDVLYPSSHYGLRDDILRANGCILSEFADDFRATQYSFPQRNRIMAGLSHAVLVIEAELKSGTLITSKYATDYNRDVFTIPHSIYSRTSEGPHMLLGLGATLITKPEDILEAFNLLPKEGIFKQTIPTKSSRSYSSCSPDELTIIKLLSKGPLSRDQIINLINKPVYATQAMLSGLEIQGLIKEETGEVRLL